MSVATTVPVARNRLVLALLVGLFFMWGFTTVLVDLLIPRLKSLFELSYFQAMFVQFGFFAAYFLVSLPAGGFVARYGYRMGVIAGLAVMAIGCFLFVPAADYRVYGLFVLALFVLASGITILQVAANPLVVLMGSAQTAASRLTLAQAFNSLGTTLAPVVGAVSILSLDVLPVHQVQALTDAQLEDYRSLSADLARQPFIVIGLMLILVAMVFVSKRVPVDAVSSHAAIGPDTGSYRGALQHRNLKLGVGAIFVYVGAEVTIGSFLVNYFVEEAVAGMSASQAASLVSLYWGGAMVGRFIGAGLMRSVSPSVLLAVSAGMAILMVLLTIVIGGPLSVWTILAVGLFNAIGFPTIFSLSIAGLGRDTAHGSGILCMSIVGGAVIPVIAGAIADETSIAVAFFLPVLCYGYIVFFALSVLRSDRR